MKSTGIIRRMDDLGRIQIPKELRKQVLGLKKSEYDIPFEFFIDGDSKEMYIKKVADKYKGQIKDNVYEALCKWEVEIND